VSQKLEQGILGNVVPLNFASTAQKSDRNIQKSLKSSYGDQGLSQVQVFQWHKDSLEGQEKVEAEQCAGRPAAARTSEDMDSAQDLMVDRLIADELNRSHGAIPDSSMAVGAKTVLRSPNSEPKENCECVCLDLLYHLEN
jgi:hypothetical protein